MKGDQGAAVKIRRAELSAAGPVTEVRTLSWRSAYRGLVPRSYLDGVRPERRVPVWPGIIAEARWPAGGVLVAEDGEGVAGFAAFCPSRDPDGEPARIGEISAIYLSPRLWGAGVGGRLLGHATDVPAAARYEQATLWALEGNARARRCYERNGWRVDGAAEIDETRGFPLSEIRYRREPGRRSG